MKVTITINMNNDAFQNREHYELARILNELAYTIVRNFIESGHPVKDLNGNRVGSVEFTETDSE